MGELAVVTPLGCVNYEGGWSVRIGVGGTVDVVPDGRVRGVVELHA